MNYKYYLSTLNENIVLYEICHEKGGTDIYMYKGQTDPRLLPLEVRHSVLDLIESGGMEEITKEEYFECRKRK